MIRTLKLKNYRQHVDTLIHFGPGVNTIVGANGAGKSTIPEAIEFALFGAKALRDTGNSYVTDGQSDGMAAVLFDVGPDMYQVSRNSKDAKMTKNKEPEASYKANVTRHVAAVTGVNQTGFRLGHYVRQKELAAFSQLRPGKRQETIEKMLKVNAVDKVLARLKTEVDALQAELETKLRMSSDLERLQDELATAESSRDAVLVRPKPDLTEPDREPVLAVERAVAAASVADPTPAIAERDRLRQLEDPSPKIAELELAIDAAVRHSDTEVKALVDRLRELQALEVKAAEMRPVKEELDRELEVVERVELPVDPVDLRAAISAAATNYQTVVKLLGKTVCPTCLREIADVDAVVASLKETLDSAKASGEPAIAAYGEALAAWKVADERYRAYVASVRRRDELRLRYVEVSYDAEAKVNVEREVAECDQARKALQDLEHERELLLVKLQQVEAAGSKIAELDVTIKQLEATRETLPGLRYQLTGLKQELTAKELELAHNRKTVMDNATELARLEGQIAELRKSVMSASELRQTVIKISGELAVVKAKFDIFLKFKRYLTAKIRPMIEKVAEALFHRVMKNRYAAYQLASDYEVIITTHQGFVRKLSTISGSENDLANLCLRLAIATLRSNRLVGNLGFIILDEITSSFDEERTRQTLEGLLELRDIIPQIINISHKPVEIQYADRLISIKEANGRATVT